MNLSTLFRQGISHLTTKTIQDDYVMWLCNSNAGMLWKGNVYCLDYAIKNLPSNSPVVEIGSFCGLSTNIINYLLQKHSKPNTLFNCDVWKYDDYKIQFTGGITNAEYRDFVLESYRRNVLLFSKRLPHTIEATSDDFFVRWSSYADEIDMFNSNVELGGSISMAYIDGCHTYDQTKKDFLNVDMFLEIGGFILFDDSTAGSGIGSADFMREMKINARYETVMKNPNYLFRKIK